MRRSYYACVVLLVAVLMLFSVVLLVSQRSAVSAACSAVQYVHIVPQASGYTVVEAERRWSARYGNFVHRIRHARSVVGVVSGRYRSE